MSKQTFEMAAKGEGMPSASAADAAAEPKQSLTRIALGGAAFSILMRLGGAVVSLGSMAILARLLTPAEYGVFGIVVICVGLATVVPSAISNAIIQEKTIDRNDIGGAFSLVLAVSLAMAALAYLEFDAIGTFFDVDLQPYGPALSLVIPLTSLGIFFDGVQAKLLKFKGVALVDLLTQNIGQAAVTLVLAFMGFGVWSLIAGFGCGAAAKVVMHLGMGMGHYARLRRTRRPLMGSIGWFVALQAANFVGRSGDNAVVGNLLGPEALGLYGRAYNLMMRPVTILGGVVFSVFYPMISSIDSDLARVRSGYLKALAMAGLLTMPAAAFACIHGREIILIMLGHQWIEAVPAFQVLVAALYFRFAYRITEAVAFSRGALRGATVRQGVYGTAVLAGSVVGAQFGVSGVAAGVSVALLMLFVVSASYANSLCRATMMEFMVAHIPGLVLGVAILVAALLSRGALGPAVGAELTIAVDMAVAGAIFAVGLMLKPLFRRSPIELFISDVRRAILEMAGLAIRR